MNEFTRRHLAISVGIIATAVYMDSLSNVTIAATVDPEQRRDGQVAEEVIVTAQRREERLQDVPIAITVLDGRRLDTSNVNVADEIARVPGMAATDTLYGGAKQLAVRGVSSTAGDFAGTSTVGYYLDSVPFGFVRQSFTPDANAYDMERVEVLRGPQGTLYGVSATNGVVRVITHDVNLDTFEFKMRSGISTTKDGGDGYRVDSAVNVPLVSDKLAVRAVAGYESLSGWVDGVGRTDGNDGRNLNGRLKLKAAVTDDLTLSAMVWHTRFKTDGRALSRRDRTTAIGLSEPSDVDYDIYAFNAQYDFGGFTLSSSSSYIDYQLDGVTGISFGGSTPLFSNFSSNLFSQEVNLNSSGTGPWRWSLGGIYRDVEDYVHQNGAGLFPPGSRGIEYNDFSESFAGFGELTRELLDGKVELTGGLRYFEDRNKVRQLANPTTPGGPLVRGAGEFHKTSPRVVLTAHPSEKATVYASYAEGFRSGFSQSPTVLLALPGAAPVGPDNLKNYEAGTKGGLFDGVLSFEGAVFYMEWEGVQQSIRIPLPGTTQDIAALVNGKSASGMGAEGALRLHPARGLEFGGSFSWNALEFDEDVFTPVNGVPRLLAAKGERLTYSPARTANLFASYDFPIGNLLEGTLSGSANHTSQQLTRALVSNVARTNSTDSSWIGRASFSLSSPSAGWNAVLFVDNISDFRGAVRVNLPSSNALTGVEAYRPRPRTFGIQVEYSFGN